MDLVSEIKKRFDLQKEFLGTNKKVNKIEPMVSVSVITYQHANFIKRLFRWHLDAKN